MMDSLYECDVYHCRLKPLKNAFSYKVFMFAVDVDAIGSIARRIPWFSHNRFNLFSIYDSDHITFGKGGSLKENLIAWLAEDGFECPADAKIQLVTFPRVLGYGFNPVSFYYIHSSDGRPLAAVAEVVNTFREMKLYRLEHPGSDGVWHRRVVKNFYVSPFSDPALEFDFRIGTPSEKWRVNIDDYDGEQKVLLSSVRGERRELTSMRLLSYGVKYPLLSLKIIGLIHWHALLLWIKKVPYFKKSERRDVQLQVLRPHASLIDKKP